MSNNPGFLISIDGIDGSGKTTLAQQLHDTLDHLGYRPLLTREPGGTLLGEHLRTLLLDPFLELTPRTEFLLFNAARSQHVEEVIRPALNAARVVITDRFTPTTYAYQGAAQNLQATLDVLRVSTWAAHDIQSDITLILDLPVETALQRRAQRDENNQADRFESTTLEFMRTARKAYLDYAQQHHENTVILDATQGSSDLLRQAVDIIQERYEPSHALQLI